MTKSELEFCKRLARGLACQFGQNCEVVVHDLESKDIEHSIVAVENGHVSGRQIGDGPSHIVLEALQKDTRKIQDRLAYLTKTRDGKILKSSTIYMRDRNGKATGIFSINHDITLLLAVKEDLAQFTSESGGAEPEPISRNVSDLLDELIAQSISLVGKPAAIMTKEEKIQAIKYLNDSGAFLITKSGPKVCEIFGISKYTLYSYLDEIKSREA